MDDENIFTKRELIVLIGITASGKSYYIDKFLIKDYQYVSDKYISFAIKKEDVLYTEETKNMLMAIYARAHMVRGLPIVVDEPNLELESLFIWKEISFKHNYKIKGIIIDTPIIVCIERWESILKRKLNKIEKQQIELEDKKFQELKQY
jgi:predicted kinase